MLDPSGRLLGRAVQSECGRVAEVEADEDAQEAQSDFSGKEEASGEVTQTSDEHRQARHQELIQSFHLTHVLLLVLFLVSFSAGGVDSAAPTSASKRSRRPRDDDDELDLLDKYRSVVDADEDEEMPDADLDDTFMDTGTREESDNPHETPHDESEVPSSVTLNFICCFICACRLVGRRSSRSRWRV
jgi:hypothetical protein